MSSEAKPYNNLHQLFQDFRGTADARIFIDAAERIARAFEMVGRLCGFDPTQTNLVDEFREIHEMVPRVAGGTLRDEIRALLDDFMELQHERDGLNARLECVVEAHDTTDNRLSALLRESRRLGGELHEAVERLAGNGNAVCFTRKEAMKFLERKVQIDAAMRDRINNGSRDLIALEKQLHDLQELSTARAQQVARLLAAIGHLAGEPVTEARALEFLASKTASESREIEGVESTNTFTRARQKADNRVEVRLGLDAVRAVLNSPGAESYEPDFEPSVADVNEAKKADESRQIDEGLAFGMAVFEAASKEDVKTEPNYPLWGTAGQPLSRPLRCKRVVPHAILPTRAKTGDAGLDLYTTREHKLLGCSQTIRTGIAVEIPPGYVGLIKGRSGNTRDGLLVRGGVIDSGYRGELSVCVSVIRGSIWARRSAMPQGTRVAQLVIVPFAPFEPVAVDELSETERGNKGFGSTGQ